ncbi:MULTISPECIES: NUDIX hydrolase [unclassified Streptomyces]|uniref:NUDIX domain-containing protein n=1 Tax=unclassified Streptomyces TaxID=2593676 RepID=UPI00036FAE05|nr:MULTISPECIES: NUDIX hydrolase [unclassified Streptomyces]
MTETETTRYTADVVALTPDGNVLLIERDWEPFEGAWALPGGHQDEGETSRMAAARELLEETGVRVDPDQLREIGTWNQPGRDPRGRYSTDAYLAVVPAGTQIVAGDDARTARWWPLDALPQRLAFDHADILRAALSQAPPTATRTPEQEPTR